MSSVLERRYRLLLGAYPPQYIDNHEEEIIGTLLEGARPGQLRPTLAEAYNLLVAGFRLRVRTSTDGLPTRNWSDSNRLAALLILASVLSDRLSGGSDGIPLAASALVACSIVAVVTGSQRVGTGLALSALVVSAIATNRWELLLPSAWLYDCSSLLAIAFALAAASIRGGGRRPWPGWLAVIAIAVPFLYRVFWLGSLDQYHIPLSIFELVLPVTAFSGVALLMHDPRAAVAATMYSALHLVVPLTYGLLAPLTLGIHFEAIYSWTNLTLVLTLTVAALGIAVASSRRQVDDLVLPSI